MCGCVVTALYELAGSRQDPRYIHVNILKRETNNKQEENLFSKITQPLSSGGGISAICHNRTSTNRNTQTQTHSSLTFNQCFGSVFIFLRIRIRIQRLRLETNTDPDTDPDPIRIQGFNDQKFKKNYSWKKN